MKYKLTYSKQIRNGGMGRRENFVAKEVDDPKDAVQFFSDLILDDDDSEVEYPKGIGLAGHHYELTINDISVRINPGADLHTHLAQVNWLPGKTAWLTWIIELGCADYFMRCPEYDAALRAVFKVSGPTTLGHYYVAYPYDDLLQEYGSIEEANGARDTALDRMYNERNFQTRKQLAFHLALFKDPTATQHLSSRYLAKYPELKV